MWPFVSLAWGGARALLGKAAANAKSDWQAIPPKVRLGILAAVLLIAGFFAHQWYAHRQLAAADKAGYDRRASEDAAALAELRARAAIATTNGAKIAQQERTKNDTDNRNIRAAADALSVRGPGAARCRPVGDPAVSAGSSRDGTAAQRPDAANGGLPVEDGQSDLTAVPWSWLVANAEEADLDRAEVIAWRDWYVKQAAEWEKLRAGAKPAH